MGRQGMQAGFWWGNLWGNACEKDVEEGYNGGWGMRSEFGWTWIRSVPDGKLSYLCWTCGFSCHGVVQGCADCLASRSGCLSRLKSRTQLVVLREADQRLLPEFRIIRVDLHVPRQFTEQAIRLHIQRVVKLFLRVVRHKHTWLLPPNVYI
jgi:hypothetical protein